MPVDYDGSRLIPAPMVKFVKNTQSAGGGQKLGVLYDVTIEGTLLAWKGSPQGGTLSSASWGGPFNRFWQSSNYPPDESVPDIDRLKSVELKQEAIRALFANDGRWLEWAPLDGSQPLKCKPRIKSIVFGDGSDNDTWYQKAKYTIQAETDYLYLSNGSPEQDTPFSQLISSASESWQIQEADVAKTFTVVHTTSAVGKRLFDSAGDGGEVQPPWQNARDFVVQTLALGYNTTTGFSPLAGNALVNQAAIASGSAINFSTLNPYNFSRNETIDELGGSYSVTETWTLSATSGTNVYTVSVRKFSAEPYTTTEVSIAGTIKGFSTNLNDYDQRFAAAQYVWGTFQGTPLFNVVQSYATGISLNAQALAGAVDYNPLEFTVGYNYQFTDRIPNGDAFEEYTISKQFSMEDYRANLSIAGKIMGRKYEADTSALQRFSRAQTLWNTLNTPPNIYNRVVNSTFFPEITGVLRQYPISKNVDMDQANGLISYNFVFNTRRNDNDLNDDDVYETYNLSTSFNRDEGITYYTIAGKVEGLVVNDNSTARTQKFSSALNYFEYIVKPNTLTRLAPLSSGNIFWNRPINVEIVENPTLGEIDYTYKYSNEPAPCVPGALSEQFTVVDQNLDASVSLFAEIGIFNRAAGPVLQPLNTTAHKMRTFTAEVVMPPTGNCNMVTSYNAKPDVSSFVTAIAPTASQVFKADDQQSWTWRKGRYTRNVTWIYQ